MSTSKLWLRRPEVPAVAQDAIQGVLDWLTPDQVATLGGLHEAPESVASSVVQLLPFGTRASWEELGLLNMTGSPAGTAAGHRQPVELTPLAYSVMAVLARRAVANPDGVEDWTRQAELAAGLQD